MGIMDTFLKLSISAQIRVGIISVVLFAIIISFALLTVSTLVQYNTMMNYYEDIIEGEDNKMLLNFEQYIHNVEKLLDRKSKTDLEFYSILENNFFESLEGLELNILLDNINQIDKIYDLDEEPESYNNCYNSKNLDCIIYKFYPKNSTYKNEKEFKEILKYYNLIFPLLNSTLQENCVGTYTLKQYYNLQFYKIFTDNTTYETFGKVIFYAGTNITPFDKEYNEEQYYNHTLYNIYDHIFDLFVLIPNFNKKITRNYILKNFNEEFAKTPLISSKYLFEGEVNNPFIRNQNQANKSNSYENDLSFESKIYSFNYIDLSFAESFDDFINNDELIAGMLSFIGEFLLSQLNSLKIFKWSDNIFENLINIIFEKYKSSLNILPVIHSLFSIFKYQVYKNNPEFSKYKDQYFITKTIFKQFTCLYRVKDQLFKEERAYERLYSFNITKCELYFNQEFEEYLSDGPIELNLFERRKIKVEITKYDIRYIYYNYTNNNKYNEQEKILYYDKKEQKDKKLSKNLNSYKIYQGLYPTDTLNSYANMFYNNFVTVNFYFSSFFSNFLDTNNIQHMCFVFFRQVLYPSLLLWGIVLIVIIIIVFRISHSISDPIDKLIQSVSMSNKSSKELNKYLKNISYKDDSTINDLFILCKKLIIGGFKKEGDEEFLHHKKQIKSINAYNNISLVKTNNMIINENEIIKGEKKQEINYFEKKNIYKDKNFIHLASTNSTGKSEKKFNKRVLSGHLFSGKFYQYNRGYLIKDKEYYDILTNEYITRKKKYNDEYKLKNNKNINLNVKES